MEELIAQRYANAILENSDSNLVANYASILTLLSEVFCSNSDLRESLSSPIISKEKKINLILDSLGKNSDNTLSNFIKVLGEKGRLNIIPSISRIINAQIQKKENSYQGVVSSKNELGKQELIELETKLSSYTNAKITLVQQKSDLDAMKVSVEDLGIEVSFSKERVKKDLIDFINQAI